jgi:hypothetical protein
LSYGDCFIVSSFQTEIVDIISLVNASLYELCGGQRRRDIRRAFALVDDKNNIYFIVTGTNADFLKWTSKINNAISLCSALRGGSHPHSDMSLAGLEISGTRDISNIDACGGSLSASSERDEFGEKRNLGKSFSRVVQVVKEKGRAIGERSKERRAIASSQSASSGEENFNNELLSTPEDSINQNDPPLLADESRGGYFRNRVAGTGKGLAKGLGTASAATKIKLGIALQNAKQKGKSVVSERRRHEAPTCFPKEISMENSADIVQERPADYTAFDSAYITEQILADRDRSDPMDNDDKMVDQNGQGIEYMLHGANVTADEAAIDSCISIQKSVAATEINEDRSGSMRSRLDGVGRLTKKGLGSAGMATKSKLGFALHAAKQRSRDVVEKRHQRTTHSATVVSSVELQAKSSWPCELCTFENTSSQKSCQMCGSARNDGPPMPDNQSTSKAITVDSEVSHHIMNTVTDELDNKRAVFEQESLGEKQSSRVDERTTPQESLDGKGRSRVSMKQRIGEVVNIAKRNAHKSDSLKIMEHTPIGAPDSLDLRSIWLKGPLAISTHPFEGTALASFDEVDLKKLQGDWRVSVEARISKINEDIGRSTGLSRGIVEDGDVEHALDNKTKVTEIGHEIEPANAPDENTTTKNYTVEHVDSSENKIEVTFRIRAFRLDMAQPETCVETHKTFNDILDLHTALSESLARVPTHVLHTGNSSENTYGVKSPYLAETRLLTTVDVVRVTGQILGGVLHASNKESNPLSNDEFLKYHCEFSSDRE